MLFSIIRKIESMGGIFKNDETHKTMTAQECIEILSQHTKDDDWTDQLAYHRKYTPRPSMDPIISGIQYANITGFD